MEADHGTRTRRVRKHLFLRAALTAWGLAAASLAVAQAPQPPAESITVLNGAERLEYVPQARAAGSDNEPITLLRGGERSEHRLQPETPPDSWDNSSLPAAAPGTGPDRPGGTELPALHRTDPAVIQATVQSGAAAPSETKACCNAGNGGSAASAAISPGALPALRVGTAAVAVTGQNLKAPAGRSTAPAEPLPLGDVLAAGACKDWQGSGAKKTPPAPASAAGGSEAAAQGSAGPVPPRRADAASPPAEQCPVSQPGDRHEAAGGSSLYQIALGYLAGNLAALCVGALLVAGPVFILLRRLRPYLDILRRLDLRYPGYLPAGGQQGWPSTATGTRAAADPGSGEALDLGPSYAEEKRLREEALRQQEEAMLRHLFEQNLKLRRQINDLGAAAV